MEALVRDGSRKAIDMLITNTNISGEVRPSEDGQRVNVNIYNISTAIYTVTILHVSTNRLGANRNSFRISKRKELDVGSYLQSG